MTIDGFALNYGFQIVGDWIITNNTNDKRRFVVGKRFRGPLDEFGEIENVKGLESGFRNFRVLGEANADSQQKQAEAQFCYSSKSVGQTKHSAGSVLTVRLVLWSLPGAKVQRWFSSTSAHFPTGRIQGVFEAISFPKLQSR
jgi:hypothetical protein